MTRRDLAALAAVTVGIGSTYSILARYRTFGPEFCWFYVQNAAATWRDVVSSYSRYLESRWYRPTPFVTVYWTVSRFVDWHNVAGWQAVYVASLLIACFSLYGFLQVLFPRERLAAALACGFVATHPAVLPSILLLSGFDFVHIAALLVSGALFLIARASDGPRSIRNWLLSVAAFIVALTSKETSIAFPVFLAGTCVLLRPRLRRDAFLLSPYFALLAAYAFLHMRVMPAVSATVVYRDRFDAARVLENLRKFPLWVAHVFHGTGDTYYQAFEQDTVLNNTIGVLVFLITLSGCIWFWRRSMLVLLWWYLVFLPVPVFAGGLLWHANLSLLAYAGLFGLALAGLCRRLRCHWVTVLVGAALVISGGTAIRECYEQGPYRYVYALDRDLLGTPPIEPSRLGVAPLIYVEDSNELGHWSYGADGNLFHLVYRRLDMIERVVPRADLIPDEQRAEWRSFPNAFFFRYVHGRWRDASAEFRDLLAANPEVR